MISVSLCSQVGKILPADESKTDSSFYSFYLNVQRIAQKHDIEGLKPLLAKRLRIEAEGPIIEVSRKRFLAHHQESYYQEIWEILDRMFRIGGGQFVYIGKGKNKEAAFYAPYIAPDLLSRKYKFLYEDIGAYSIIIADSVKVYEAQSVNSRIIRILSYDIVKNSGYPEAYYGSDEWIAIELKDKKIGYIQKEYSENAFTVQCKFSREGGLWKLADIVYISE